LGINKPDSKKIGAFNLSELKVFNRYLVMLGAVIAQLCLGSIYAWTIFQTALYNNTPYQWNKLLTQLPFSVGLASFALFMIFAGKWQDRVGPTRVATVGGILLGLGYILAGMVDIIAPSNELLGFLWLIVTYGVISGAGIGFAYVCPIAALVKWFPDLKGLITGIAVAGFGAGALIFTQVETALIPEDGQVGTAFFLLGIFYLVAVVGAAQLLRNPPTGWTPESIMKTDTQAPSTRKQDVEPSIMIKTPEFWLLWGMFVLAAAAGLMTIGNVKSFAIDQNPTIDAVLAATIAGILSIFNAAGRIVWGAVSDRIGRTITMILMFATLGVSMFFFGIQTEVLTLTIGAALIGFCFGGNFALFPSATADYFGTKNLGSNYGLVFTAYGVAGILGPFLAGVMDYADVFPLLGFLSFLALALAIFTEYLARRKAVA
jgi:OFA family oxalate/formate antiporter-like MFS transporter